MKDEIFIIYAKKNIADDMFDYKNTVKTWEECMEILEMLAKNYKVISFVNIEDGKELLARTFEFRGDSTMTQTAGFGEVKKQFSI